MSMIKCPHCGKNLPSESAFCPFCMEQIKEPVAVSVPLRRGKRPIESVVMIAVTVVLVLTVAGLVVLRFVGDRSNIAPREPAGETERLFNQDVVQESGSVSTNATTEKNLTAQQETECNLWNRLTDNEETATNAVTRTNITDNMTSQTITRKASETTSAIKKPASATTQGTTTANRKENITDKTPQGSGNTTTTKSTKPTQSSNAGVVTTKPQATQCSHSWVEQTKTVHHPEEGHYAEVEKSRAVTEYRCAVCYDEFSSVGEYYSHFDSSHRPSYQGDPIKALREQYTTSTGYEYYTEQVWVTDREAYDETVVTGYKCTLCGKTK